MKGKQRAPILFVSQDPFSGKEQIAHDFTLRSLALLCERLNLPPGDLERERLRQFVAAWQESGPNFDWFARDKPEIVKAMQERIKTQYAAGPGALAYLFIFLALPPQFHNREEGAGPVFGEEEEMAEDRALASFCALTLNPHWERLAGPCARCGAYFIRKRSTQKVYCSRRCGNASTAVARTRARLETEHRDKMRRAEAAIRAWNALKTRGEHDWLRWLAEREPDITGKFITRHVNAGKLPEPKRGRRSL